MFLFESNQFKEKIHVEITGLRVWSTRQHIESIICFGSVADGRGADAFKFLLPSGSLSQLNSNVLTFRVPVYSVRNCKGLLWIFLKRLYDLIIHNTLLCLLSCTSAKAGVHSYTYRNVYKLTTEKAWLKNIYSICIIINHLDHLWWGK